jgi:predicted pyridoxine 5'-phosphate oxidase superfamily flavin-nucleotide-binding protein
MKKSILLFSLMLVSVVVFGQADPIDENPTTTGLPSWLEAAVALLLAVVPSGFLVKAKYRLGKFVSLTDTLTKAMEDNRVDNNEITAIKNALKDLVKKEES